MVWCSTTVYRGLCRILFRKAFSYDEARVAQVMSLNEKDAIENRPLLLKAGGVLLLVTVGFVLHSALGTEVSVVALLGAGLLVAIAGLSPTEYLSEVEWPTLVFFAGLFIMVGGLIKVGVIGSLSTLVTDATGGNVLLATMLLLVVSGVLSGIVDNIPYVATMAPPTLNRPGFPRGADETTGHQLGEPPSSRRRTTAPAPAS